ERAHVSSGDAVVFLETLRAAGTDVHLLDDRAVAPPFRDQLRVGPDGEDVPPRGVADPLDADLALRRSADGGLVHLSPPPSLRARRSSSPPRRTTSSARTRSATWSLGRASRCR